MTKKKSNKEKKNNIKKTKHNYLVCRTTPELESRLTAAAKIEKRSVSNLVCVIVEAWLDDNEIE